MAVNYPSFRADPNGVPKITGPSDLFTNIAKGYQLATAPKRMQVEQQLKQAQLEQAQQQNFYNPQVQRLAIERGTQENEWFPKNQQAAYDAQLAQTEYNKTQNRLAPLTAQASINQANASAGLTNEQRLAAEITRKRNQAFYDLISGGNSGGFTAAAPQAQGMAAPSYAPGTGRAPTMGLSAPPSIQGAAPVSAPGMGQDASAFGLPANSQILTPGNPAGYRIDSIVMQHPEFAAQAKEMGYNVKTENVVNPKTGQLMTVTTLPSGRQFASSAQVGPTVEDQAYSEKLGTNKADAVQKYTDALDENIKMQMGIDSIVSKFQNPNFLSAVGPWNAAANKAFGSGEAAELYSDLDLTSKQMQVMAANSIGSQAARARLLMGAMLKPNPSDRPDVMLGKAEALNRSNRQMKDYNAYMAKAIREGVPQDEAVQKADKLFSGEKYEKSMRYLVQTGELAANLRDRGADIKYNGTTPMVLVKSLDNPNESTYLAVSDYNKYMELYQKKYGGKQ